MNNTNDTNPGPIPGVRPGQENLYRALVHMHADTPLPKLRPLAPAVPSPPIPKLLRLPTEVVLPKPTPRRVPEQLVVARQTRDGVLRLVRDGRRGLGLAAFSVVLAVIALLR